MIEAPIEITAYSPQPELPQFGLSPAPVPHPHSAIFKAVRVNADAHRISRALTEPEYLEAWIAIPGATSGSFTRASTHHSGYRLDYYSARDSAHRSALTIEGSFLFCHLRKMRLSWRKTSNASFAESVVDFRLRGNFASSIVELRHTALASGDEYAWHESLWRHSLHKLVLLFGSS